MCDPEIVPGVLVRKTDLKVPEEAFQIRSHFFGIDQVHLSVRGVVKDRERRILHHFHPSVQYQSIALKE